MWLFTTFGFFSIVQKEHGEILTIRARVRGDLDRLRQRYLPSLSRTVVDGGTDYRYRATATRADVAAALRRIAEDVTYANFKDAVADELGPEREALCHRVWEVMLEAERLDEPAAPRRGSPGAQRRPRAYGGVVVNDGGEVLLYEPKGHFGGMVWTFPKGTPEAGEKPEQTAVREVQEETNVTPAEIIGRLPGAHAGAVSETVYFLMKVNGRPGSPGDEAQAVRWVPLDRADELLRQSTTSVGRERDLRVLAVARELIAVLP